MTDVDKRPSGRRNKRVQRKHGNAAKTPGLSALAHSTASKKAARTRVRRATVLKTLKTGEESFSVKK